MGYFCCDLCLRPLNLDVAHVCDPDDVRRHVHELKDEAWKDREHCRQVRDRVLVLLAELPSLQGSEVVVRTDLLRDLYAAAAEPARPEKVADHFHARWASLHRILVSAFDVFRRERPLAGLLTRLREDCLKAREVMGYQTSELPYSPEDVLRRNVT